MPIIGQWEINGDQCQSNSLDVNGFVVSGFVHVSSETSGRWIIPLKYWASRLQCLSISLLQRWVRLHPLASRNQI